MQVTKVLDMAVVVWLSGKEAVCGSGSCTSEGENSAASLAHNSPKSELSVSCSVEEKVKKKFSEKGSVNKNLLKKYVSTLYNEMPLTHDKKIKPL